MALSPGVATLAAIAAASATLPPLALLVQSIDPAPVSGWTGLWLFPFGVFIIPAIVWFVKTQGALNRYWESKLLETAPLNQPGAA